MELTVIAQANDGRSVKMTAAQASAIESISNTRKGGCASIRGYRPSTGYKEGEEPTHNIQMITHFSQKKLYERKVKALQAIQYKDVAEAVVKDATLSALSASDAHKVFTARKEFIINQLKRNLDDAPKNAHQDAHVRCYAYFGDCRVHLVTEQVGDHKMPTQENGVYLVDSIIVPYLELNKTVVAKGGDFHVPKSKAPTLMGNLIEACLNKKSVSYKTLSLKANNFESFNVDRMSFTPEDVASFGDILTD